MHSDASTILAVARDGVLQLGFHRPQAKNALTQDMYLRLARLLGEADADDSVRAIVLHGSEDVFTSGNDVREFAAPPQPAGGAGPQRPSAQFMEAVLALRKPLLAAVNGPAVGIGATMLLHCDLVYAGSNARIAFSFVRLGLCPEFGSSLLLPRIVGQRRAMQLLLSGDPFSAAEALELGLVNEVLQPEQTLARALEMGKRIAAHSAEAVAATRRLVLAPALADVRGQIETERRQFQQLLRTPAAKAAFERFLEKKTATA